MQNTKYQTNETAEQQTAAPTRPAWLPDIYENDDAMYEAAMIFFEGDDVASDCLTD